MDKIDVAGLKIDPISKQQLLDLVLQRITSNQKTWITTVYSEFLYAGLRDPKIMEMLNKADVAVADGIGIFWAKKYSEIPLSFSTRPFCKDQSALPPFSKGGAGGGKYWLMILQAFWQLVYSLAAILFYPRWILNSLITPSLNPSPFGGGKQKGEKIVGADLIWDLANLAVQNNLSIYLLGGYGETPKIVSEKILPVTQWRGRAIVSQHDLVAGNSNKNPNDSSIIKDINSVKPAILLVAYGPIKQEKWINDNISKLNLKVAIGVGGSFDYIAGVKSPPPNFVRYSGLEWLWRLITQSHRLKRIFNATFGLAWALWHYKVFSNLPLRKNVAVAILNQKNQVLLCQRNPKNFHVDVISTKKNLKSENYWQLPQGGADSDEDLIEAAKREALEETGLKNLELIKVSAQTHTYIWNNALRGFWKNRFKQNIGQTQNIVYFRYLGSDDEVKIDGEEFVDWRWTNINQLEITVHPERLPLIKIALEDLKNLA